MWAANYNSQLDEAVRLEQDGEAVSYYLKEDVKDI